MAWLLLPCLPAAGQLTDRRVAEAIRAGAGWLGGQQNRDGSWSGASQRGGMTGLCTLALLNAGADADDPTIQRAIRNLNGVPNRQTYVVSLKCQVLAAADPDRYAGKLAEAARFLADSQLPNGMWSYAPGRNNGGDNSNTQFALLGLYEAFRAGAPVPRKVFQLASRHYVKTQAPDGGWGYRGRPRHGYGSMTAAGVASLAICGHRLMSPARPVFIDGACPSCGRYRQSKPLAEGLAWLVEHFSVRENPRRGSWLYYYLYALERAGMMTGLRAFGRHDWYRQGAGFLVTNQHEDGHWGNRNSPHQTAFALLFLAKGNRPLLVQKVQWEGRWNRNLHDLENLTDFLGEKLGGPVGWQNTPLDVPLESLRASPILYITGHEFPDFSPAEKQKLKDYVARGGGTLLFEACCASKDFAAGFARLAEELWPGQPATELPPDHPVYHALMKVDEPYGLRGIAHGCRTAVFFSPRALSVLWELQRVPTYSERAFHIGANLAAYATGGEKLLPRLANPDIAPQADRDGPAGEVPRGAVRIARLVHEGGWNLLPHAEVRLAKLLSKTARIDVVARSRPLRPTDEAIYEYPVVFMTGVGPFEWTENDRAALRAYLKRGGFLLVNNGCGRRAFDRSFRENLAKLFPDSPLKPLPADHPIYTAQTGIDVGQVRYRPGLAKELGVQATNRPPLEAVLLDGRACILYSPYDLACALSGVRPFGSRGYQEEGGRRLAMAMLLFAITY